MTTDSEIIKLWHDELSKFKSLFATRVVPTLQADEAAIRLWRMAETTQYVQICNKCLEKPKGRVICSKCESKAIAEARASAVIEWLESEEAASMEQIYTDDLNLTWDEIRKAIAAKLRERRD